VALKSGKVAICISGQLRTGILGHDVFRRFFGSLDNYDIFYHTWTLEPDVSLKLQSLYNPMKFIEEPSIDVDEVGNFGSMLYSIMMANELKKQHEIENNFRYDLVIKTRFDLIFHEHSRFPLTPILPRTIYSAGGNVGINNTDYEHHGISDLIFWGDSQSMDIACNTFRYYKYTALYNDIFLKEGVKMDVSDYYLSPGTMIYQKTIEKNIAHIRWAQGINEIPWREDVAHLDPTKDYDKIRDRYAKF
jgi:hypothetical protein